MVQFGRDASLTPAAQAGHNSGTVAICVNGLTDLDFTSDQFNALRRLCREIDTAHGGKVTFHGHCEVSSKSCPVFDYKQVLKLSRDGHLPAEGAPQEAQGVVSAPAKAIGVPETAASTTEIVVRRVTVSLEARPTHPDVKRLQRMLSAFSPVSPGECDGVFGEKTRASLIAFQEVAGLIPDGVAGPVTWETLERYK
jgi:peptidoglycan hydrolase-like protein with peptidoglycan-binding domain